MLEFIIIGALVSTIIFWWKHRRFFALTKLLPHNIKSFPILGVSYLFFGDNEAHLKAVQVIGQETNKQGGIIAAWFGPRIYVSITDPFLAEFVLKTCLDKDDITRFSRISTGYGTIFAPVSIWRRRRRLVSAGFSLKNLMLFVNTFAEKSTIMAKQLQTKVGKGPVSLWSYINSFSFDTVFEATLGAEIQSQRNPDHPFLKKFAEGITLIATRTCQPWLHSDLIYKRLPCYGKLVTYVEIVKDFVNGIIKTKQEVIRLECSNLSSINNPSLTHLEILLREFHEKQGLTNEELQDEMITFLVAGTDTIALTIGFTLHMLARHPDIQDQVYDELKEVFGRSTRRAESEDLAKLKYLDLVIKETLRLYPPGVVLLRKVIDDVKLPSGLVLPAGCGIAVNVWATHRNQEYWGPDAEVFRPERFLIPLKHLAQYIPFSVTPRNCIGYQFAMLSMKTAISTVLRRCKVSPAAATQTDGGLPPLRLKFDFLLKDIENFTLCLDLRDDLVNKVE